MSHIFGGPAAQPTPVTPTPTPPPPMPDPLAPAVREAQRVATAKATQGGRSSTILTTNASRSRGTIAGAGMQPGTAYSASTLGGS